MSNSEVRRNVLGSPIRSVNKINVIESYFVHAHRMTALLYVVLRCC